MSTESTLARAEPAVMPTVPGGEVGAVVEREGEVGLGEAREQPVGEHRRRAAASLLGRLADDHQRAAPAVSGRCASSRAAPIQHGHVHVVAAGVHDRHRLARVVLRR